MTLDTRRPLKIEEMVRGNLRFLRAQHLAEANDRKQWSQDAVASRLGLLRATYVDIEAGKRGIRVDDLLLLALVFDVSPRRLLMPPGDRGVALGLDDEVDQMAFAYWLRGLAPLPGQDEEFFTSHDGEQSPGGSNVGIADGRRGSFPSASRGLDENGYVLSAERALAELMGAYERHDEESADVRYEALDQAISEAAEHFFGGPRTPIGHVVEQQRSMPGAGGLQNRGLPGDAIGGPQA